MSGDARPPVDVGPRRLVVVVGTGTEVGKTWVSCRVLQELRTVGMTVSARKPAQSFSPSDPTTDAHQLGEATDEERTDVCPLHRWYEVPMAPPMAAEVLGRPGFGIDDLVGELGWGALPAEVGLIESAGGVRSPLAGDGDSISLIEAVQPQLVVVVASAELGTVNDVRLTMEALDRGAHIASLVVFLNRYDGTDDLQRRNRDWLSSHDHFDVVTTIADLAALLLPPRA